MGGKTKSAHPGLFITGKNCTQLCPLKLMVCNKRILVLRLHPFNWFCSLPEKGIFRVTSVYAVVGVGLYAGSVLWEA